MSVLKLTIKRKFFDAILDGSKRIEYRDVKPHWSRQIEKSVGLTLLPGIGQDALVGQHISMLCLTAGYRRGSPRLIVGVDKIVKTKGKYEIHLGQADRV